MARVSRLVPGLVPSRGSWLGGGVFGAGVGVGMGRCGGMAVLVMLSSAATLLPGHSHAVHLYLLEPALDLHIRMWKCNLHPSALETPLPLHGGRPQGDQGRSRVTASLGALRRSRREEWNVEYREERGGGFP